MSDPVVLRVVRPYASEAELLDAEGWTIGMKRLVLIDERPLKKGTVVHVELVLETGEKLLRAECKVVGMARARSDRPKGLEVRLKRYGASTRRFLERATAAIASAHPASEESPREPSVPEVDSSPNASAELESSPGESLALDADTDVADQPEASDAEELVELVSQVELLDDTLAATPPISGAEVSPESDQSGVRVRIVEAPPDREALLERLRERARRIANARED